MAMIVVSASEMSDPFAVADGGHQITFDGFLEAHGPLGEGYRYEGVGAIIAGIVAPMVNGTVGDLAHIAPWLIFGADLLWLAQVVLGRLR